MTEPTPTPLAGGSGALGLDPVLTIIPVTALLVCCCLILLIAAVVIFLVLRKKKIPPPIGRLISSGRIRWRIANPSHYPQEAA